MAHVKKGKLCFIVSLLIISQLFAMSFLFARGAPARETAIDKDVLAEDQTLYIGLTAGDLGTIDPHGGVLVQDRFIYPHVFDSLVRYPLGNHATMDFEPSLATNWNVSDDGLVWTFYLREGVKWHRGFGEFTSEDVVYSIRRTRDGASSAYRSDYENIKEVKALDKYTVQITHYEPEPFFLTKCANVLGGYIVCKKAVEAANAFDSRIGPDPNVVIGTGPFVFERFRSKSEISFVRNEEYWGELPIIERIVGKYFASDGARELALLRGEIASTIGQHDYAWITYVMDQGIQFEGVGPIDLKFVFFNPRVEPFDDIRIREAFAYAIGQRPVLEMQGAEISEFATSPIPTDGYGHVDAGWEKYIEPNPEKAKALLAEAGYPNGLDVTVQMSTGWWYLDKFIVYQSLLEDVGINMRLDLMDHTAYRETIMRGGSPIGIWGSRYPFSITWLRNHYHSAGQIDLPTASMNYMYYSNPEVDRLIEIAETTFDEKERLDALARAQRLIVQDLPAIPSIETYTPYVRNPWFYPGYEAISDQFWAYEVGPDTRILKH